MGRVQRTSIADVTRFARNQLLELGRPAGAWSSRWTNSPKSIPEELVGRATEDLAQRWIRLQHRAVVPDQRHADGGVGEGFLEAVFAFLELFEVARGFGRFALGGLDALFLRELDVLHVAEIKPMREHDAADDGKRGEEDPDAEAFVAGEKQCCNARTTRCHQRHPPILAQAPAKVAAG